MPDTTSVSADATPAGPSADERPGVVTEVQRAVILVHGFIHAALAIPMAWLWWRSGSEGASTLIVSVLVAVAGLGVGGFELHLSAQTGRRRQGRARLAVAVYALVALAALVGTLVPVGRVPQLGALWVSTLTFGSTFSGVPALAIGLQAVLLASTVILACAVGRRTLIAAAPAWLPAWLLSHAIRAILGAAYYLVYDLGAEPLWRRIQALPRYQAIFLVGGGPMRVVVGGLGGPGLAGLGAVIGWGLILLGRWFIPPILHPLLYLVAVDLVLLPLLPTASAAVIWLYRKVAGRGEAWVFVASPVFVALAPVAVLVLLWLALHRWLLRAARWVGQWQLGAAPSTVHAIVGAGWIHLAALILVAGFNAQTGLLLIGRDVPGAALFERHQRTLVTELPSAFGRNRDALLDELYDRAINHDDTSAYIEHTILKGDSGEAPRARFCDLSFATQRRLAGLPWYYSPAAFEADRIDRCAVFWGCLLLAIMTMIRWPGLHALLPHTILRGVVCALRLGAPAGLVVACLAGASGRPDTIAMIAALVLVGAAVLALAYWLAWAVSRDVGATRHYAPFMATRLLQKRRIAFFAIGAVTLCVAMVLIVISVMGGFLDLVRDRSRGLLGDLVMENQTLTGFAGYQEFIDHIKQLRDEDGRPIVTEATPVIYTYGVLRFPISRVTNMVRVVGVRKDESIRVTRFGQSLNYEKHYPGTTHLGKQQQPYWGQDASGLPVLPPDLEAARQKGLANVTDPAELALYERAPGQEYPGPQEYAYYGASDVWQAHDMLTTIRAALQIIAETAIEGIWSDPSTRRREPSGAATTSAPATQPAPTSAPSLAEHQRKLTVHVEELIESLPDWPETKTVAKTLGEVQDRMMDVVDLLEARDKKAAEVINVILGELEAPIETLAKIRHRPGHTGKFLHGVILGRDIVARRQASRRYERYYPRGTVMTVAVLPLTTRGAFVRQQPIRMRLRYVDDSRTGVYEIDSVCIYVRFELLQDMMKMGPLRLVDGSGHASPRASQVLIKLAEGQDVMVRRAQLLEEWRRFCETWPHFRDRDPMDNVRLRTWEEQQAQYIAAVQKEKILVLTLFAVVSAVAIFLVVCIFYMIVTEKTRDIGILKSVGASAGGVSGVFLAYGAAIGVVGASLGLWIGTVFVHNINSFQDWIARIHPGLRIWSAEVYTFDIIPDTVKFEEAAVIFVVAVVSSVLGATIPALRAGRTWPVEALRYE